MYFSPKSKNLYIIGNGFDLYLWLKTSYNDFFKNKNYISIRKDIQNKIDSISLLKSELENKNEIDRNFNNSKIGIYNLFLLYLLLEEDNKTVNWNDVEKKILPAAKKIQESLFRIPNMRYYDKTEIRNRIVEKIIDRKSNNKELDFLKELNKFEKEFGNYIAQINNDLFDIGMGTFKDKNIECKVRKIFEVDNKITNIVINFNYTTYLEKFMLFHPENKEIIEKYFFVKLFIEKYKEQKLNFDFLEELNKFEHNFGKYIEELNEIPLKSLDNISYDENIIKKIEKIFGKIDNKKEKYIVNFNYTNYLDKILMYHKMTNVHGTFENPIFGIDNTEIGNDRKFYYLTKTSRVLFNNTIKEEFKLPNKIEISKICFFGHSLARADYSYFQSIFDYYDIYNSEVKLEFKYYNYIKDDEELNDKEKEERKDEVKSKMHKGLIELMNDYGNTASNKSKGQNLLRKLILENRIEIVEVE